MSVGKGALGGEGAKAWEGGQGLAARMAAKSGFAMKKYAQMNDEVEQIDSELGEMLEKARKDIEALEWDTNKVALPKEQRDAEVARIKGVLASARSVHQVPSPRNSLHQHSSMSLRMVCL